jgi:hypothetical protein
VRYFTIPVVEAFCPKKNGAVNLKAPIDSTLLTWQV